MRIRCGLPGASRNPIPILSPIIALMMLAACGRTPPPAPAVRFADPVCDLNRSACEGKSAWGKFTMTVSPRPVPVLTPVDVELRFHAPAGADATIELTGAEMDMGPNRIGLQRVDDHTRRGQFVIPICITGSMRWRMTLTLRENRRSESIAYDFIAPTGHHDKPPGLP